jgi:hypothetical protein
MDMLAQKISSARLPRDEIHSRMFKATVYEIFRLATFLLRFLRRMDTGENPNRSGFYKAGLVHA